MRGGWKKKIHGFFIFFCCNGGYSKNKAFNEYKIQFLLCHLFSLPREYFSFFNILIEEKEDEEDDEGVCMWMEKVAASLGDNCDEKFDFSFYFQMRLYESEIYCEKCVFK